jgi:predicted membrane protein
METSTTAAVLATLSKHDEVGIAAVVVGLIIVGLGFVRVAGRAARAVLVPIVGVVVIIVGILFFTRTL